MSFNGMEKFSAGSIPPMKTQVLWDGADCYHWRKTFAYWPVKTVSNRYVWFKTVYKRRFWVVWGTGFHMEPHVEYGTLFDVIQYGNNPT